MFLIKINLKLLTNLSKQSIIHNAMLLSIYEAKAKQGEKVKFSISCDLPQSILDGRECKFLSPVNLAGEYYYKNEKLFLDGVASVKLLCICDNCGEEFEKVLKFNVNEVFVESYNSHDIQDYLINQASIMIDEPLKDNLLFSLSTKLLCKQDCKGLCSVCGKNKNYFSCNCENITKEIERQEENPFNNIKNIGDK